CLRAIVEWADVFGVELVLGVSVCPGVGDVVGSAEFGAARIHWNENVNKLTLPDDCAELVNCVLELASSDGHRKSRSLVCAKRMLVAFFHQGASPCPICLSPLSGQYSGDCGSLTKTMPPGIGSSPVYLMNCLNRLSHSMKGMRNGNGP